MRNLNRYAEDCMEMLDAIGIEYGDISEFMINTRAKRRWGLCKENPDGTYIININSVLLDEEKTSDDMGLINTIIHELLHSCKDCMNHGSEWKRLADKVNREYGLNIKTRSTAAEKGVIEQEEPEMRMVYKPEEIKHRFVCEGCGATVNRKRESNFTKHPERYRCVTCGGMFKKIF